MKAVLSRRAKQIYLACFFAHCLLISTVCCNETFRLISEGFTIVRGMPNEVWRGARELTAATLGQNLPASNPVRQGEAAYLHLAGIEAGYGFFAPNIPAAYKLIFEIHYSDGQVEYETPRARTPAGELRLAGLLDKIGARRYDPLRELMIKLLAHAVWREHPKAVMIRAIVGSINPPKLAEFEAGPDASYEFLYSYDFVLRDQAIPTAKP